MYKKFVIDQAFKCLAYLHSASMSIYISINSSTVAHFRAT